LTFVNLTDLKKLDLEHCIVLIMHVGEKIKLLRTLRKLSQTELAEKINKTRALVSNIEKSGKVNHYTLKKILSVLNVTMEEFEMLESDKIILIPKEINYYIENEIKQLKEKLNYYQKANETLQELVDAQKIIINSLKKRINKNIKESN
jgi:transcriptional regulator with XRE-family HTH domain